MGTQITHGGRLSSITEIFKFSPRLRGGSGANGMASTTTEGRFSAFLTAGADEHGSGVRRSDGQLINGGLSVALWAYFRGTPR